jgi:hypothetical protein
VFVCGFGAPASAAPDATWFESGDTQLRVDLILLNDAEVIRLPVTQWPMPRAAVRHALTGAKSGFVINSAVAAALERVRIRVGDSRRGFGLGVEASAGEAGLWRDFDTLAREDAELTARAGYDGGRFSASLSVTGVADPDDGQEIRADGSHVTAHFANWLLSANTLDRYWGPGHQSSLILSNNARPMPTVMIERAEARAFETPWLSWLGPWRMSFGVSRMEEDRVDIRSPLFLAWRVVVMPFKDIELGFSRTAQFCGEGLECNLDVFGNLLAGNDNVGIDATPENEPGNQMAGFDIRYNSPIGTGPYAIYAQAIGEDESSYLPAKYLFTYGAEIWRPFTNGSILQGHAEYSSTTCSPHSSRGPYYNCAYNQGLFQNEGYRYRGRVVGYTSDRDAENYAIGATLTEQDGTFWSATARLSRLNRDDFGDNRNLVSQDPADYHALELGWVGKVWGEKISIDLGVQSIEVAGGERDTRPFGFVSWRHDFAP